MKHRRIQDTLAFGQGQRAWHQGRPVTDNPYRDDKWEDCDTPTPHYLWHRGWTAAQRWHDKMPIQKWLKYIRSLPWKK